MFRRRGSMRQAATALSSSGEFGTGLRARLEVVRTEKREAEYLGNALELRRERRGDVSPELALVSPELSLGELLFEDQVVRDVPLGTLLGEAGLLGSVELIWPSSTPERRIDASARCSSS